VTLSGNLSFSLDLEEQASRREIKEARCQEIDLENRHQTLQRAALGIVAAVNARGVCLADCLQDIPVRPREVATHGVHYGASVALAAAQLRSGHELHHLEPGFLDTDRLEDQEGLIGDFIDAAEDIAVTIHAQDVVNNIFLGP